MQANYKDEEVAIISYLVFYCFAEGYSSGELYPSFLLINFLVGSEQTYLPLTVPVTVSETNSMYDAWTLQEWLWLSSWLQTNFAGLPLRSRCTGQNVVAFFCVRVFVGDTKNLWKATFYYPEDVIENYRPFNAFRTDRYGSGSWLSDYISASRTIDNRLHPAQQSMLIHPSVDVLQLASSWTSSLRATDAKWGRR